VLEMAERKENRLKFSSPYFVLTLLVRVSPNLLLHPASNHNSRGVRRSKKLQVLLKNDRSPLVRLKMWTAGYPERTSQFRSRHKDNQTKLIHMCVIAIKSLIFKRLGLLLRVTQATTLNMAIPRHPSLKIRNYRSYVPKTTFLSSANTSKKKVCLCYSLLNFSSDHINYFGVPDEGTEPNSGVVVLSVEVRTKQKVV
jgi:hypothetical protein